MPQLRNRHALTVLLVVTKMALHVLSVLQTRTNLEQPLQRHVLLVRLARQRMVRLLNRLASTASLVTTRQVLTIVLCVPSTPSNQERIKSHLVPLVLRSRQRTHKPLNRLASTVLAATTR